MTVTARTKACLGRRKSIDEEEVRRRFRLVRRPVVVVEGDSSMLPLVSSEGTALGGLVMDRDLICIIAVGTQVPYFVRSYEVRVVKTVDSERLF